MSCCRFSRSFPLFSIFYSSLVSCLIVVLLPPGDRRQSCRLICGSPSDLPLYRYFLRASDRLCCGQRLLNHIPSNSPPVVRVCVAIRSFLDVISYFSKKKKFNDWNRQPRGSLSDSTFSPCQPPTPYTMEWQPQQEPLRQLACCLRNSLDGYNRTAQKEAEQVSVSISPSAHACLLPPPHFDLDLLPRGIVD